MATKHVVKSEERIYEVGTFEGIYLDLSKMNKHGAIENYMKYMMICNWSKSRKLR